METRHRREIPDGWQGFFSIRPAKNKPAIPVHNRLSCQLISEVGDDNNNHNTSTYTLHNKYFFGGKMVLI